MKKIIKNPIKLRAKDLMSFQKLISKIITLLSIGSIVSALIVFSFFYFLVNKKEQNTADELINSANSLLMSNLSEQISIIGNNSDFIDYLRSGVITRQENYTNMEWLFSDLDRKLIPAISVTSKTGENLFSYGKETKTYSSLAMCYINGRLNPALGQCDYQLTVYFNEDQYVSKLKSINKNIDSCQDKKCRTYPLLSTEKLGEFPVLGSSKSAIKLNYREPLPYQLIISLLIFLLFVMALLFFSKWLIKGLVTSYLITPISEIQRSIALGNESIGHQDDYLSELSYLFKTIKSYKKQQINIALGKMVAQVAHDIRSPLAALNICLKSLPQIPEEQRVLMRNAANRINDIANNLLLQHKGKTSDFDTATNTWLLSPLVETLISEKRMTLSNKNLSIESEISQQGFFTFAEFNPTEMKRLLSNLINNSVEAMSGHQHGVIKLSLDIIHEKIHLAVSDNGSGISQEVQEKILANTLESTKEKGNGLGLSHAKKTIEALGGSIRLISSLGHGTQVLMTLPSVKPPSWLISNIEVSPSTPIAILDDDPSVHGAWDNRLDEVSKNLEIHHFYNSSDFMTWYEKQSQSKIKIFSDYELLGDSLTGLDVLEKLELSQPPVLVTSHYENQEIIERCEKNRIKLLPKNLLAHVLIQVV